MVRPRAAVDVARPPRVNLDPPHRIDVAYTEGPFKYLNNYWLFERVPGGWRGAADPRREGVARGD